MADADNNVKKTIVINTDVTRIGKKHKSHDTTQRRHRTRQHQPPPVIRPNTLKKTLLERIRQHQKRQQQHKERGGAPVTLSTADAVATSATSVPGDNAAHTFASDFKESLHFLKRLSEKRREERHRKRALRKAAATAAAAAMQTQAPVHTFMGGSTSPNNNTGGFGPTIDVTLVPSFAAGLGAATASMPMPMPMSMPVPMPMSMPMSMPTAPPPLPIPDMPAQKDPDPASSSSETGLEIPPAPTIFSNPPHGCLKNGSKPTFREWMSSKMGDLKSMFTTSAPPPSANATGGGSEPGRLPTLDADAADKENAADADADKDDAPPREVRRQTRKTTIKRFKLGKQGNKVSVLIKNNETRKLIQQEHLSLKQATITDIKKFLYDKNLLKIGSSAPPDVLRRMYEDAILTGDVQNVGKGVTLHNFISGSSGSGGSGGGSYSSH